MNKEEKMATEEIIIKIAKSEIRLNVDESKVELYRLAEQRLNASIVKFKRHDTASLGEQTPLALAAFETMVNNITLAQHSEIDSEEIERLAQLEQRIESYVNDLKNEE